MLKPILLTFSITALFACHSSQPSKTAKPAQIGYLKNDISQTELNKPADYKRYYYSCHNAETGATSYLTTYFPLSRESRKKENFGFYFQLDGGKVEPFDHIENRELNARGSRFEVIYRSYQPIGGGFVDLVARQHSSTYYKDYQGMKVRWLDCRGG